MNTHVHFGALSHSTHLENFISENLRNAILPHVKDSNQEIEIWVDTKFSNGKADGFESTVKIPNINGSTLNVTYSSENFFKCIRLLAKVIASKLEEVKVNSSKMTNSSDSQSQPPLVNKDLRASKRSSKCILRPLKAAN